MTPLGTVFPTPPGRHESADRFAPGAVIGPLIDMNAV